MTYEQLPENGSQKVANAARLSASAINAALRMHSLLRMDHATTADTINAAVHRGQLISTMPYAAQESRNDRRGNTRPLTNAR